MRVMPLYEKMKRGCHYCNDMVPLKQTGKFRTGCPHNVCPYHVLDKYDTYEEFIASEDSRILTNGFFQTVASCYEMVSDSVSVKQIYSDRRKRLL